MTPIKLGYILPCGCDSTIRFHVDRCEYKGQRVRPMLSVTAPPVDEITVYVAEYTVPDPDGGRDTVPSAVYSAPAEAVDATTAAFGALSVDVLRAEAVDRLDGGEDFSGVTSRSTLLVILASLSHEMDVADAVHAAEQRAAATS